MSESCFSLQAVCQRTGLSAHVIRAWERRYGAVSPARSNSNRRLYSQEETDRLDLLAKLTRRGHAIGNIARLEMTELRSLADALPAESAQAQQPPAPSGLLGSALEAVAKVDGAALEKILQKGAVEMGAQGVLQRLIAPLVNEVGERWRRGELTAAHEHFASAVIRTFLGYAVTPFAPAGNAPVLVVGTPVGQLHELGALMAGAVAANLGWNVVHLGAGLPAAEIAGIAKQRNARAIALSLIYPEDDSRLGPELERLRSLLGPEVPLLIGGRAAHAYAETLQAINAVKISDLDELGEALDRIRKSR